MIFKLIMEQLRKNKEQDVEDPTTKSEDLPPQLENFLRATYMCNKPEKIGKEVILIMGCAGLTQFCTGIFDLIVLFITYDTVLLLVGASLTIAGSIQLIFSGLYIVFEKSIIKYKDEAQQVILQTALEKIVRAQKEQEKENNVIFNSVLDDKLKCLDCRYKLAKTVCLSLNGDSSADQSVRPAESSHRERTHERHAHKSVHPLQI